MAAGDIKSRVPDAFPPQMYVAKITAGATSGDVLITSSATYTLLNFPANAYIYDVFWQVTSAFTANVDLSLGTSTGTGDFADVADVDATNVDTAMISSKGQYISNAGAAGTSASTGPLRGPSGFIVPSTGDVLNITVETTTAATGAIEVWALYTMATSTSAVSHHERHYKTKEWRAGHGI